MADEPLERALKLALALFPIGAVDRDYVVRNCDDVLSLLSARGEDVPDRDLLIKELESRLVIWQERSSSLEDRTDHVDWLEQRRDSIEWRFWDRYRRYLEQVELLPPAVIGRLDDSTDSVLAKLESPDRPGEWDRRGLVVGQVQSGKTSHYTGLACKAADAGYKLIVVLAGMHNSLRSQTQLRLDAGMLGFDTQYQSRSDEDKERRIGVGALSGAEHLRIGSLTTSAEGGDFKKSRASSLAFPIDTMPVLLVVKKNASVLNNLHEWVTSMHGEELPDDPSRTVVRDIPLLIIDDEADNASINTKSEDDDPAVINQRIRRLLFAFDKSAYVGYTATPFANIYSSTEEDDKFGMDLFPRHFIESLKPPSNYFGPTRVFGLPSADDDAEAREPLPIFRKVDDYAPWLPDKHRKDWRVPEDEFPGSLRRAILSFFLVCAARRARGQVDKHNSMLIHTTRLQNVQQQVAEQVETLLISVRHSIRYGDGAASRGVLDELEQLWAADFSRTSEVWDEPVEKVNWELVRAELPAALNKIHVKTINGSSGDALEYYENRKSGLSVIAIGGDKLSRGLTLEGLSVSYYLRATRMYDTLLQMGRWFGYRPGYEDLCRLYTTELLHDWYREITAASEELRESFDDMSNRLATPEEYGLRVRQSPSGLSVTSPTKMRAATTVRLTFSGQITESVTFDLSEGALAANRQALEGLLAALVQDHGDPDFEIGNRVWTGVSAETVASFFDGYRADKMAHRSRPELIATYIRDASRVGELTSWTVALISPSEEGRRSVEVGAFCQDRGVYGKVALTQRSPLNRENLEGARRDPDSTVKRWTIRRVLSPSDEVIDFDDNQKARAIHELRAAILAKAEGKGTPFREPEYARGETLRRQRPATQGLLLLYLLDNRVEGEDWAKEPMIGFAVSFPFSRLSLARDYKVNQIWYYMAFEELEEPDAD